MQTCGVGSVSFRLENGHAVVIEVLVMVGDLLGFDLLMGIDAIKALGGVSILKSGEVQFPDVPVSVCAAAPALIIEEPDFQS